jgi:glycerol-3-phosphate dehydrogenase
MAISAQRQSGRESLSAGRFDVLVIGGGILGISTAWVAARSGLRVALVDKGDFASATSSASTKLVHGGLRYLAMGALRGVQENHAERRDLADRLAPHHVRPLPFLMPLYGGASRGRLEIGAGVVLYSALSKFADGVGRIVSTQRAQEMVPSLRTDGLRACGLYYDHQMNDGRLAVTVARAAAEAGAVLVNYAEAVALRTAGGRVVGADLCDALTGDEYGVSARVVVNATGPWVDDIRRLEDRAAPPSIRLSKGAHVVLRQREPWKAALTVPVDESRVSFAIPWEDHLLLGTTDEPFEDDAASVRCTDADVDQILGEAAHAVLPEYLDPDDVVYRFAGLRVLPAEQERTTTRIKRETVITVGPRGMISVAGGKWTTFRLIGTQVFGRIRELLPDPGPPDRLIPLPGAARPDVLPRVLSASAPELPDDVLRHLSTHYGNLSHAIIALTAENPALAERIHPGGPDIWAQVVYAAQSEWACTVDDVLRRRTTVTVRGLDTPDVRERVAGMLKTFAAAPSARPRINVA